MGLKFRVVKVNPPIRGHSQSNLSFLCHVQDPIVDEKSVKLLYGLF